MSQLHVYIEGWRRHDVAAVLGTLTDDCVIIESYGPVYRGRQRVGQWMHAWFDAGGSVDGWEITGYAAAGEVLMAEWRFHCTWQGKATTFEGATIARLHNGQIAYLREYTTTAPLYDWTGTWRE
jgi:ketosteroid isomerase-like protein